ncbi:MAG: aminotransferase class V-fold PLP-dependent enzyme, partial [Planctomycetaceae bacterium]|nr:aminotransferase class V-fold PLP-dependent enzyme [Planctomycetaceae bacterium]
EGGSLNMPGLQALGASLGLLLDLGPAAVSRRILERAEAVRERAASAGWRVFGSDRPEDRSGIVALERDGVAPDEVARRLRRRGVVAACRRGRLRISAHVYNNDADLDLLEACLASER